MRGCLVTRPLRQKQPMLMVGSCTYLPTYLVTYACTHSDSLAWCMPCVYVWQTTPSNDFVQCRDADQIR